MIQRAATIAELHLYLILSSRLRKLWVGNKLVIFLNCHFFFFCGTVCLQYAINNGLGCYCSTKFPTCLVSMFVFISLHTNNQQFAKESCGLQESPGHGEQPLWSRQNWNSNSASSTQQLCDHRSLVYLIGASVSSFLKRSVLEFSRKTEPIRNFIYMTFYVQHYICVYIIK